jgi:hypothetical protein
MKLGLRVKESKCDWIRRGGEFLKPINFLGASLLNGEWFVEKDGLKIKIENPLRDQYKLEEKFDNKSLYINLESFIANFGCTELLAFLYNKGKIYKNGEAKDLEMNQLWHKLFRRYNLSTPIDKLKNSKAKTGDK